MTGICGASNVLAIPYPSSTCLSAPGLRTAGGELVHRAAPVALPCLFEGAQPSALRAVGSVWCRLGALRGPRA